MNHITFELAEDADTRTRDAVLSLIGRGLLNVEHFNEQTYCYTITVKAIKEAPDAS